jgi:Protein of unknown function (DUF4231)
MELFKRFPKFRLSLKDEPIVPLKDRSNYPSFAADFELLDKELIPRFYELDKEALRHQNHYRWMYVVLICGSSVATILGITQLALRDIEILGILGAIVAAGLAIATFAVRSFNCHERYLNTRLAAERLRSEYFLFLGHYKPYENAQDRTLQLRRSVKDICQRGMQ